MGIDWTKIMETHPELESPGRREVLEQIRKDREAAAMARESESKDEKKRAPRKPPSGMPARGAEDQPSKYRKGELVLVWAAHWKEWVGPYEVATGKKNAHGLVRVKRPKSNMSMHVNEKRLKKA